MTVHLVGAGPGDPGLITARGLELVRSCDVLVHDRLVAPELVAEAPSGAVVLCRDGLDQNEVTELLVDSGRLGLDVVRLKGGDPFVFGRGGEEALALQAAGIACEIVPGVSSLAAVPAAAGIPVTHRGVSDHVTIASCHGADGGDADYARLAASGGSGTLVLFMGLGRVARVVAGLLAAGMAPGTPAAAISRGTLPDQEVVRTTLQQLAGAAAGLAGPALIVVGDVAAVDVASHLQTERFGGAEAAEPERAARHRALAAEPA
jgi:uroporphyrin-III C-methyltransferase